MRLAALAIFAFSIPSAEGQPFAYVLNRGSGFLCRGGCLSPTLTLVNLANRHTVATISLGLQNSDFPHAVLSPDASRIYAATYYFGTGVGAALHEISTATNQIVGTVSLSSAPIGIDIAPDGSFVVVLTYAGIVKVNAATRTIVATAAISEGRGLTVSPDGSRVYSVDRGGTVRALDASTLATVSTLSLTNADTLRDIAVSPDGSRLYVADTNRAVWILTTSPLSISGSVGDMATYVLPSPDGARLFTTLTEVNATQARVNALTLPGGSVLWTRTPDRGFEKPSLSRERDLLFVADPSSDPLLDNVLALNPATGATVLAFNSRTAVGVLPLPRSGCFYEVSAASRTAFGPAGGDVSIDVPAPAGCSWSIASSNPDILFTSFTSGTGPAVVTARVPAGGMPLFSTLTVAGQHVDVVRAIPHTFIDQPRSGTTVTPPFTVSGWAIDQGALSNGTVAAVHVYAYPQSGGAPIFLGVAVYGADRNDVATLFGTGRSVGFSLQVSRLAAGRYTIVAFAQSSGTGQFQAATTEVVVAPSAPAGIVIDTIPANASVFAPLQIGGWAIDPAAASGTGVDAVHVWAHPNSGAAPSFLGAATLGRARPDISALFGSDFLNSGFDLTVTTIPAGDYRLVAYAHSTATGAFSNAYALPLRVLASTTYMNVDAPVSDGTLSRQTGRIFGWAIDARTPATGSGVDAVHVWAFPSGGGSPVFLCSATMGLSRLDVAAIFGSRAFNSGFSCAVNPASSVTNGTYDVVVYARTTATGLFDMSQQVVRVTIVP